MIGQALKTASATIALIASLALPGTAQAADKVKLMLDWTPGGLAAAWYYGIEQGCFSRKDIDLTVERGYGGSDTVTKIAAGTAEFGTADLSSIMIGRIKADTRVKAIMPIYSSSPIAVAVLADSGIAKVGDLEGKTVASAPGDSGIQILPVAFEQAGADFAKVKTQTVEPATLAGLLIQGKVDAITTYVTTAMIINRSAEQAGKSVSTINFGADLGVYSNSVLASDALIESNPDLVKRFREAAICAYDGAKGNLPAAVKAMDAAVTGMDIPLHTAIAETALPLVYDSPAYKKSGFGWDPAGVAATLSVAAKSQGITTDADPMSFVVAN